jgi:DNA-binding beta-propeller fold protein YncE/Tol biopolymer transport system component
VGRHGSPANGASSTPSVSGDGRYVVFVSDASNLVAHDVNHARDIFVRDVVSGSTRLVSVSSAGAEGNADSSPTSLDLTNGPSISADGRYVAFASDASNLVSGDTNGQEDCFVRDLKAHTTVRVSVSSGGAQGTGICLQPVISASGRYVVFASGSHLTPGLTGSAPQVFIRDLQSHTTRLVSVSSAKAPGNSASLRPAIASDGSLVAFESFASNLVPGDTNNQIDAFVHSMITGHTQRISISSQGAQGNGTSFPGFQPAISSNDRYVVFYTNASNLVAHDTNASGDVMVRDLKRNITTRVSVSSSGAQGDDGSLLPSISSNGRYIAFESKASNLSPGDGNGTDEVFIRDQVTHQTQRLARTYGGPVTWTEPDFEHADIATGGTYVAFASKAANLVSGDTNNQEDVFVRGPLAAGLRTASPATRARSGRSGASSCTTAFASAPPLTPSAAFVSLTGPPFGIAVTPDGAWSFVAEQGNGKLAVLSNAAFRPRVVRSIPVPTGAQGDSVTPDGRYLLVADGGDGATVVSVSRAKAGAAGAVLGTLSQPDSGPGGAIEVANSPDGRYAFVSVEYEARIAVYDLSAALADHFSPSSYIGSIPVDKLPNGLAVSPDGRWLYVASEAGSLSVIRLATAETHPTQAVVSTVPAGCNTTRVVPSPDGTKVWVTARASDQLLAFSAAKLRTDPAHARLAAVRVGEGPIGLALIKGGQEVVVADSDRFNTPGAQANLILVRAAAALAHHPALIGTIHTGLFPREITEEPGRPILLVGNNASNQLEAVDIHALR